MPYILLLFIYLFIYYKFLYFCFFIISFSSISLNPNLFRCEHIQPFRAKLKFSAGCEIQCTFKLAAACKHFYWCSYENACQQIKEHWNHTKQKLFFSKKHKVETTNTSRECRCYIHTKIIDFILVLFTT